MYVDLGKAEYVSQLKFPCIQHANFVQLLESWLALQWRVHFLHNEHIVIIQKSYFSSFSWSQSRLANTNQAPTVMLIWSTHPQSLPIGFSVDCLHFTQRILPPKLAGLQPQLIGHETHIK